MVQQTAVEWLENELENNHIVSYRSDDYVLFKKLFEQAKKMHEAEIVESFENGENNIDSDGCYIDKDASKKYYNETFNK